MKARRTALGVYVEIGYTVTDDEAFAVLDGSLWFDFLDENGQPVAELDGGTAWTDPQRGFMQENTLEIYDEEIASFTVQAYECWDKQRFETKVIEMKPAK